MNRKPDFHPTPALLDAFPPEVWGALNAEEQSFKNHDMLFESDERSKWAYFPHRGMVVSMTRTVESGATVEVGIIGADGVVGIQTILLPQPA